MENTASQHSCISRPASASAGESSWAMHFACFLQASTAHSGREMDRLGGGVSDTSGFSSSFDSLGGGDEESFITSGMVCHDDEDDSLQDTACSSPAEKMSTIPQLAKYLVGASSPQRAIQEVICGGNNNENQLHGCNDLRKRGLCLVPLSMLVDYLG